MKEYNYKVYWIGTREGYGITLTDDRADDNEVFETFREAKQRALNNARDDIYLAKIGLQQTKTIRKGDIC